MARSYTVQTRILRPVADVFDAVIASEKLCNYFTSESSGDLEEGSEVNWRWQHYNETLPVIVNKVVANKLIELTLNSKDWKKTTDEHYDVRVIFEFEELDDGNTMLSISEDGWRTDEEGLKGSHDNCGGWTHMAMCLKGWIEHNIDLR
ncbi:MAG: SRPBCC domain-containing protein [Woeseiaceae bacterium]